MEDIGGIFHMGIVKKGGKRMECTLYLTDDCNLRCSYCYEGNKKNKSYMNEITLERALEFIVRNNLPNDPIDLLLLGGEPLMNKKMLYKTIDIINHKYQEIKQLFRFQMTTNGILLDDKMMDFVEENQVELSISIDGDRETHNLNRKSVSKKDVYDIILNNMQRMLARGMNFSVRMTITSNNVHLLCHNVQYFYDLGVRKINIGMDEIGEWTDEKIQVLDEQLGLVDAFYLQNIANDENAVLNLHDYKISTFVYKRNPLFCSAGSKQHVVINSKGDFFPCGYVANEDTWKLGNVETFFDRKKFIQTARKSVKKVPSCRECEIAFTCCGAKCGFLNYSLTGFLNVNHEKTCKIQRILFNHNMAVFEKLYRNYNPRMINMLHTAMVEKIPLGDAMIHIINKVESERSVN